MRNRKRRQRRSSGILSFATLSRYVINLLYHNPKASSWEFQELCPNVLIVAAVDLARTVASVLAACDA